MTNSNGRSHRRVIAVGAVVLLFLILPTVLMFGWMQSRGDWHLSASNAPNGVAIDIYWGNATTPKYSTTLVGKSIPRDVDRVTREDLPSDVGVTTFYDDTLRPGRWMVVIDGVELDIMEAGWDIDGSPAPPRRSAKELTDKREPE